MGESDHRLHVQQRDSYKSIEEPLEESEGRRESCRCRLDGSVVKLIGASFCIAGAIATCKYSKHRTLSHYVYITCAL